MIKINAKQTVSQLAHLNNVQKHMEDTLIDSETTRTAVKQDLTEAQALINLWMHYNKVLLTKMQLV